MQQHNAALVREETIPGHACSKQSFLSGAQHGSQDCVLARRLHTSCTALATHGMLREPAVLLQPGPCGSSESFPRGQSHLSQSCEFHCAAPDRRSAPQVMHVRAPAQVEWPSPSQTTSVATTSLHLTGAGRSVGGDQPPGQHALTETRVSSLTEHRANFWVNQEWWVAPTQLSTPLQPHPQGYEMHLSQRKAPGYLTA